MSDKRTAKRIQRAFKLKKIDCVILSWPDGKGYRGVSINNRVYHPNFRFSYWSAYDRTYAEEWRGSYKCLWKFLYENCRKAHFIKSYCNGKEGIYWRDID